MLDKMIENKLAEVEHWKTIALGTTASGADIIVNGVSHKMDKVQTDGNPQKMADAIAKYVDIEREINNCIDDLIKVKNEVINVIEQTNNPLQYDILHKHYIQHKSLSDIAIHTNYSYAYIVEVHGKALKKVQKILDLQKEPI